MIAKTGRMLLVCIAAGLAATLPASQSATQARAQLFGPLASETATVAQSTQVLRELNAVQVPQIPHNLLASAEAVAIIPGMMRGAFVVGLQRGRGVVLVKDETGLWSPPQFVTITGGSVGWQAGLQATDLVLVFASRGSVQNLLQGKITVGVDASAAAGPIGRRVSAATDLPLKAEIYSYSRSRGLFAGVSLDGSSLQMDPAATNQYYATAAPQTLPPTALELIDQLRPFAAPLVPGASAGPVPGGFGSPAALGPPAAAPSLNSGAEMSGVPALPGVAASGASLSRGPLAAAPPAEMAESIRRQLPAALARLDPLLDPQWKAYLQVPDEVLRGPSAPSNAGPSNAGQNNAGQNNAAPSNAGQNNAGQPILPQVVQRYDAVATNPQYAGLGQRPEFQLVRQLLHRLAALPSQAAPLNLPPPPRQ